VASAWRGSLMFTRLLRFSRAGSRVPG
jgi:hypothetical protein